MAKDLSEDQILSHIAAQMAAAPAPLPPKDSSREFQKELNKQLKLMLDTMIKTRGVPWLPEAYQAYLNMLKSSNSPKYIRLRRKAKLLARQAIMERNS